MRPNQRFTHHEPPPSSASMPPTSHQLIEPAPESAASSSAPNTVATSVPGSMPISVPSARCQSFMRTAPATMPSMAKGASGTRRSSVSASRPCFFSTSIMRSSRGPARRRTVSRRRRVPTK